MSMQTCRTAQWRAAMLLALALVLAGCNSGGSSKSTSTNPEGAAAGGGGMSVGTCTPASNPGGPYCLIFSGSLYDVHVGQSFKVALVKADGSNTVVAGATIGALPGPSFTLAVPQAMVAGVPYYVDYYADNDRNGTCTSPTLAGDHVWRSHTVQDYYHGTVTPVTAQTGDVTFSAPHDDPFVTDPASMDTCPQLNQVP